MRLPGPQYLASGARLKTIKVLLLCECEAETQQFSVCLAAACVSLARRSADVSDNQSRRRPKRNHRLQQLPSEIHQVGAQTHSTVWAHVSCDAAETLIRSDYIRLNVRSDSDSLDQIICVNVREKLNENFKRSSFRRWCLLIDQLSVKSFNEHKLQLDLIPSRSVFTELLPSFFCLLIKLI